MRSTILALLVATGVASAQTPPVPAVSAASPGVRPNAFHASVDNLASRGFVEQEFFVTGFADGRRTPDEAVARAPYTTRILVRRPIDAARFNGTVVVEWLNNALGFDLELGWPMFAELLLRDGYAWVGISAQPAGIEYMKKWDPQRYGSLVHPAADPKTAAATETYSDGMFSQLADLLRAADPRGALGGLRARHVLAFGSAGAAIRLKPFINNVSGRSPYDGYFVHATAGAGKIRDDLPAPVFYLNSEWEAPAHYSIRQADSRLFRYWEVPGSSHIARLAEDTLIQQSARDKQSDGWSRRCDAAPAVVSIEYVSRAALHHLREWVKEGKAPPHAPLIRLEPGGAEATVVRDRHGNALDGIRLPHVEAPMGRHLAVGTPRETRICTFTGGFVPFGTAALKSMYPTPAAYLAAVERALERAQKAGYLLPADGQIIRVDFRRHIPD